MDHATANTAVPEVIARQRAEDAPKIFGATQRIAERRAVDGKRISIDDRNLLDRREQQRRGVIAVRPVARPSRSAKGGLERGQDVGSASACRLVRVLAVTEIGCREIEALRLRQRQDIHRQYGGAADHGRPFQRTEFGGLPKQPRRPRWEERNEHAVGPGFLEPGKNSSHVGQSARSDTEGTFDNPRLADDAIAEEANIPAWSLRSAEQVDVSSEALTRYAARGPTRSEHMGAATHLMFRHHGLACPGLVTTWVMLRGQATRHTEPQRGGQVMNECSAYVGLDVHKDTIAVAVALCPDVRSWCTGVRSLLRLMHGEVLSFCYGGPCGYWVYREIIDTGHHCEVVVRELRAVRVPDEEQEAMRDLTQALEDMKVIELKVRQRLCALLLRHGRVYREDKCRWGAAVRASCEMNGYTVHS